MRSGHFHTDIVKACERQNGRYESCTTDLWSYRQSKEHTYTRTFEQLWLPLKHVAWRDLQELYTKLYRRSKL